MHRPARVLAYARVSSADQAAHGTSLDAQQEEARRYCAARAYPEPLIFVEAESGGGTGEDRDEQMRLMANLRAGDLVIVAKQDRWSRDTRHFLASIDRILAAGAGFVSLAEGFDPSTPEGRMVSTVMAAVAEQERARIRQRTIGARRRLRALGYWVEGPPPFGYDVVARKLVVNEPQAAIVRQTFTLAATGHPTRAISAWLSDEGHEADAGAIARRLRDRRYLGEMPALGKRGGGGQGADGCAWITGAHEPIVSAGLFAAVAGALSARRVGGQRGGESRTIGFVLRGIAHCAACGRALSSQAPQPGKSVRHGGWYRCAGGCLGHVRHDVADELASGAAQEQFAALAAAIGARRHAVPQKRQDTAAERERIATQRARLVDAIAAGVISHEAARGKLASLDATARALDARDVEVRVIQIDPAIRRAALADVRAIEARWKHAPPSVRRQVLALLADRATIARAAPARRWARTGHTLAMAWREIVAPLAPSCAPPRRRDVPYFTLLSMMQGAA